ncbi:MAG TPA: cytochrome c biogenesis CcdA family protein [Mycobacteriales bacterium]|nr:cytochrome c biogenesis CcdA family protein [Mycobacteriales bacterium]
MALALVVAFGFGVLSFLAPCTVPLLPAYVAVLSTGRRLVPAALLYVLGFTVVFVALGIAAGSFGRAVRAPGGTAQRLGGVVVLAFAALLLAEPRLGLLARLPARRVAGTAPFALGLVSGTAFTPCVGPFLGAVLTVTAVRGGSVRGGVLLGAYSLGLGVPFVAAACAVTAWPGLARRLARVSRVASVVGGVLLAALGLLLVTGAYGHLASRLAGVVT